MATNLLGLNDYIRKGYEEGRAQGDQQRLRGLAPQVLSGDAGATAQAYAIDPQAAQAYEKGADRIGTQVYNVASSIKRLMGAGQEASAANLYRQFANSSGVRMRFPDIPRDWDKSSIMPVVDQIMAQTMGASGAPTNEMRTFNAMTEGFTPEDRLKAQRVNAGLDPRAVTGAVKFGTIVGADGRTRATRQNPATMVMEVYDDAAGDFVPLGSGAGAASVPPTSGSGIALAPARAGGNTSVALDGVPQELQQRMANMAALMQQAGYPAEQIDAWMGSQLDGQTRNVSPQQFAAPAPRPAASPALGVSRSPEEQAALTTTAQEQAKINAEMGAYTRMTGLEADRAAAVEGAKAGAKTQAEVSAQRGTRARDAQQVLMLLDEAERLIPQATGGSAGALIDQIAGAAGHATEGAKATAALRTIAGQLTSKQPRMEGPQSNADVEMYKQMAGDLANPNLPREQRLAAAKQIRRLNLKYASQNSSGGTSGQGPAVGAVEGGYRFKGGNPADPNAWERI
ncbi:hypothetical protein [Lysobacter enzymogenes]|uniref:hypothetical protein n=1 Tax=Lysobacter enzymogenes TaxID=69 RepID=UPI00089B161E|nr:hypothetical protein [Lysobacter enzymogenes]SDX52996.1 hypothetical protein SAMN05421681_10633 [Lysobacter enzymogenes]